MHPFRNLSVRGYFHRHRVFSIAVSQVVILAVLAIVALNTLAGGTLKSHASAMCSDGDMPYAVASGDTLETIAMRYNTSADQLAMHNQIANANQIYVDQRLCIPVDGANAPVTTQDLAFTSSSALNAVRGTGNPFPYGQCTWWANQRYHQLHGIYVPWTTNSDAWLWTARAQQFHWRISSKPSVGAIIDLQPWTQGAYNLGHVAVVEKIQHDGSVVASNMNWAGNGSHVVDVVFRPGRGVTFITI